MTEGLLKKRVVLGEISSAVETEYPKIHAVHLHLDNDPPGRKAAVSITEALEGRAVCFDVPPPEGKDFNDYLKIEKSDVMFAWIGFLGV